MSEQALKFKSREEILVALVNYDDDHYLQEKLYPHLAAKFADRVLVPAGADLLWELCLHDTLSDLPFVISMALSLRKAEFISAMALGS